MSEQARGRLLYVGGFDFPTTQARGIQTLQTAHALARAGWGIRLLVQRPPRAVLPSPVATGDSRGSGEGAAALSAYGLAPHPRLRIVPLSVAKMNRAAAAPIGKAPAVPLNTAPVGAPGTVTTSGRGVPAAL